MINVRRSVAASVLVVGVAGIAACSPGGSAPQTPSAEQALPATSAPARPGSAVGAEHNQADVRFAKMMIPHHRQALRMAEIVLAKPGLDPQVRQMAEKIQREQRPQIQKLQSWLNAWNAGPAMSLEQAQGMQGLLSAEQLAKLKRADGAAASKLFLKQMIAHHEGAVSMAQAEIRNGTNPQATKLAHSIVASQQSQIQRMRSMLGSL